MTLVDDAPRARVAELAARVRPYDAQEERDQAEILRWVASGEPLFRTVPPTTPPKHLCVYIALLDEGRLLLVDHIKAGCWLLPGGHVDDGEDPRTTVIREAREELGTEARPHPDLGGDGAFFLSLNQTRGSHSHTDVLMWFVVTADLSVPLRPDPEEFRGVSWRGLEAGEWDREEFDPAMGRFVGKLARALGS